MTLVVDASVAVEYLLRSELGVRLTPTLEFDTLAAPELMDAEVSAVLRRHVLHGGLDEQRAVEALDDLAEWDLERLPHRWLLSDAWQFRHNASAYDALYLAVARVYDASLLTADGPLARVPLEGITIHNVRRWPAM